MKFFRNKAEVALDYASSDGWAAIHRACAEGKLDSAKKLYGKGASLDVEDSQGRQPLFVACGFGHLSIAKWLHSKGASVYAANFAGDQALHNTCDFGHAAVVCGIRIQTAPCPLQSGRDSWARIPNPV
jgi:ankyrin repeat protein